MLYWVYNVRSLIARKGTTLATLLGVGVVMFLFVGVQMFTAGLETAMGKSGEPDVAVILQDGRSSEAGSMFDKRVASLLAERDDIVHGPDGKALLVASITTSVRLERTDGDGGAEVLLRGMTTGGMDFRKDFELLSGRLPADGADEAIVGSSIHNRFRGLSEGDVIEVGHGVRLTIVGQFTLAESASLASEIWTDIEPVRRALGFGNEVTSLRVRLRQPVAFDQFKQQVEEEHDVAAHLETVFYAEQSRGLGGLVRLVALIIVGLFSLGAALGATITMHTSIAHRRREIALLLALGFSRRTVFTNFIAEACFLALLGGMVGFAAAASLSFVDFTLFNPRTNAVVVLPFVVDGAAALRAGI